MDSPNYFLADLPPNADLTSPMILEACQTIRRNRLRYLAPRSTENLIRVLSDLAKSWLDPEFPFRKKALELGPGETGFSKETLSNGLDLLFAQLTPENFRALLIQEIGHVRRLDKFSTEDGEGKFPRASIARAPELIAHISGGVLPNPTLLSMVFGLLIRSAQFVKCGSGTSFLPRLFGHSLYQVEPKLASCLEIAEWKGGTAALDQTIFSVADLLTVTGSDETLQTIRGKIPAHLRLIDYGHRVSFAYITREIFSEADSSKIAKSAAEDVVAWDQLGCLSPHVIFVETGGKISPNRFAEMLANEFAEVEKNTPRGKLSPEVSATIAYRRSFYEIRAANSAETQLWSSANSTEWTVIFETDAKFQSSCLHRFVYVKAVANLREVLEGSDQVFGKISTVGLAAPKNRAEEIATELAHWGVSRVCPLGQMQNPPLTWRHDGRPALADWLTWTDWESHPE